MIASVAQFFLKGLALGALSTVGLAIVLYVFEIQNLDMAVEKAHRLEVEMLERYKKELEETVKIRTRELRVANEKAEHLLLNILPRDVAKELTEHPDRVIAHRIPKATVLFTDIVGFTKMSSGMSADETVAMLNEMFSLFDERAEREGIEKIKTIGDAYMAVAGLSSKSADDGEEEKMVRFAQGLLDDVRTFNETFPVKVQIRVGINTGALVAGVIGKTKFIYDIWGDTVNVASRMESTGIPMKIHVSEETYQQTKDLFKYSESVDVEVKGKGTMQTYFLS
jgi:class 3 adenylate cyclase